METRIENAPAKYKSFVWKFFGFKKIKIDEKWLTKNDITICKLCSHELKYTSKNTSNMAIHLKRKHGIDSSTTSDPTTWNKPSSVAAATSSHSSQSMQPSQPSIATAMQPKLSATSARAKQITRHITTLLATDLRPFTLVDNKAFKDLIRYLEPKYSVPCRTTFSQKEVPSLYNEVQQKLFEKLDKALFVALTTDGWTSRSTTSYITITCHFIDSEWKIQSYVLQTRPIYESHTGSNIADVLKMAVGEWKLEKLPSLQSLTSDSAANMGVAAQESNMTPHIKCFAHIINLAAQQALKINEVQRLMGRIRRVVSFFHRSSSAAHQLRLKQELLQLPKHKLICEVKTRWNSAYDMVERYLEQQPAIMAVLTSNEIKKDKDLDTLTTSDISAAENFVVLLKPLKTITTILCEDHEPTVSNIMPLLHNLMRNMTTAETDTKLCKQMKEAINNDLQKRYKEPGIKEVILHATVLDPRFKQLPFLDQETRFETYTSLVAFTDKITTNLIHRAQIKSEPVEIQVAQHTEPPLPTLGTSASAPDENNNIECIPPPAKKAMSGSLSAMDTLLGDVFIVGEEAKTKSQLEVIEEEIHRYKNEAPITLNESPLNWWKDHQFIYPHLNSVAKVLLGIPATSVASERIFSTAGDIVTAQRAALSPENVDMLIFLKKNSSLIYQDYH